MLSFMWSSLVSHSRDYLVINQAANVAMVATLKTRATEPFTNTDNDKVSLKFETLHERLIYD